MNRRMSIAVRIGCLSSRAFFLALVVALSALALDTTDGYAARVVDLTGAPTAARLAAGATNSSAPHVMVIVEENRTRNEVIGASAMPYFNSLARKYADTTTWEAVGHPSLPD